VGSENLLENMLLMRHRVKANSSEVIGNFGKLQIFLRGLSIHFDHVPESIGYMYEAVIRGYR
jgi:hypothetical protein